MKLKTMIALAAFAVASVACASTNYVKRAETTRHLYVVVYEMARDPELADPAVFRERVAALDEACSKSKVAFTVAGLSRCCPKTVRLTLEKCPDYSPAVKTQLVANCSADAKNASVFLTPGEDGYVNYALQEMCTGRGVASSLRNLVLQQCIVPVRKTLRAEGSTFVGKEGAKLVKERLDAIANELNAPGLGNAGELVSKLGIAVDWEFVKSRVMKADEIAPLKKRLLDGEIPFASELQQKLCVALGVTAYNEFVREYNGK